MFEGKHIHFSPIDQKPLCSFSTKLCRQRRLNGFAFCIRHILEDSSAPFRVCSFVAPPGQNKCTNVISMAHPKGLCNTHLQLAGFPAAKRDRRHQKKENGQNSSASSPNEKISSQSNEPTSSSMEMSDGDPYTFSDDTELATKTDQILSENHQKPSDISSPPHSSPLAIEPLTPSSTSSSSVDSNTDTNICKSLGHVPSLVNSNPKNKLPKFDMKPKVTTVSRKKKPAVTTGTPKSSFPLPAVLQQLDDSLHGNKAQYLLPKVIDDSDDEEVSPFGGGLSRYISAIPLRSSGDLPRSLKLERSKKEFRNRYLQLAQMIDAEEKFLHGYQTTLATKLMEAARRCPYETGLLLQGRNPISSLNGFGVSSSKIFSKRRCSFRRASVGNGTVDTRCPEFCLPCSTLCNRHILYSVDQQLFEFCSARGVTGPTTCGAPVLAIHSGLPYCPAHSGQNDRNGNNMNAVTTSNTVEATESLSSSIGNQSNVTNKSNRRKARSRSTSSLGRHSRRLRNRRRAKRIGSGGETRIHCIEAADNGMELDVETVDSPENCSPAYPTPAQLIPHTANPTSNPMAASVDHEVEILEDHDLKELLNRLPDEAFQEIFAMTQAAASSSRNGGLFVPSREEAEELERVLAVEGVPIMDKYTSMGGVGHESDLSDLSLIDDHTLALAHDLMTMGAGASAQSIMMGSAEVAAVSNHLYMDNLSIPQQTVIHPDTYTIEETLNSPMLTRRKSLPTAPSTQQTSPARGSSPPSMSHHHHDSSFIEDADAAGAAAHPL